MTPRAPAPMRHFGPARAAMCGPRLCLSHTYIGPPLQCYEVCLLRNVHPPLLQYDLTFTLSSNGSLIMGTVCGRNDDHNNYYSPATLGTLCSNVSCGVNQTTEQPRNANWHIPNQEDRNVTNYFVITLLERFGDRISMECDQMSKRRSAAIVRRTSVCIFTSGSGVVLDGFDFP